MNQTIPSAISSAPGGGAFAMSATQLVAAMHHHPDAGRIEVASLFKTGELDVDLLERAQLHVSEVLKRSPLVAVEIATYRTNLHSGRKEAVFGVRSDGVFIGHYAASAFRRLSA